MRLIFAGTPEFARVALVRLCSAGFKVSLVLTQPDRPAGRGLLKHESPVKRFAFSQGIAVAQPRSLRLDGPFAADAQAARQAIIDAQAQVMVVAAYGLILPQWVLDLMHLPAHPGAAPAWGCINIHASLLPRWRGAAPIHRAIEAGDTQTGVTIMQMDAGLDTGDVLLAQALPVQHDGPAADSTGSLHDKLAALGAALVVRALDQAQRGQLVSEPQQEIGSSYARKVEKSDAQVDWATDASQIERRVRAFNPTPGAWSAIDGTVLKLWRSELAAPFAGQMGASQPQSGTILAVGPQGVEVACGQGVLRLLEVQRAGARRMQLAALLHGFVLRPGMRFGAPAAGA